jgi:hypothetical protein
MCSKLRKKGNLEASHRQQESPLSMTTITELSEKLQDLLTEQANTLAKKQALSNGSGK